MNVTMEILLALTSAIFLFVILYFLSGVLLYDNLLSRRMYARRVRASSREALKKDKSKDRFTEKGEAWFHRKKPAETAILSGRGELLHGYIIPAPEFSDKWVICIHGYTGAPDTMGPFGRKLHYAGYNTLYPALRGHEKSEKNTISMGWHDRLDLIDWCRSITDTNPAAQIVLFGVSMGASTAMMASGEDLPESVRCIVADCGFSSVWDIFAVQLKKYSGLPAKPFLYPISTMAKLIDRLNIREASCVGQVKKSRTPTLFIHGDADELIPYSMMEDLYEAAGCEKEKLLIPDGKHGLAVNANPKLYWSTVKTFLRQNLAEPVRAVA